MTTNEARKILQAAFPECSIVHGWILAGPGAARFGWAARHASGKTRYLGKTADDAVQGLERTI